MKHNTTQLPVNLEFIHAMRSRLWQENQWDKESMINKATYLAVALSFDTGRRIGHFTHKDGKSAEDHCLKGRNVYFHFRPCKRVITCGDGLRTYFMQKNYAITNIECIELLFTTQKSKPIHIIGDSPDVYLRRDTDESSLMIDMFADWMRKSNVTSEMEIFTWTNGNKQKLLLQSKVRSEMKITARSLGIDSKRISSRSTRKGFATAASINDQLNESTLNRGGWATGSTVPHRHYVMKAKSAGGLSMVNQINTDDLK